MASRKAVGADEEMFYKAFEDTPRLKQIMSLKEYENELQKCMTIISNTSIDWDKRVDALKRFRALFEFHFNGLIECDSEFFSSIMKSCEISFQANLQDLRSQVVRETCITISLLSLRMQQKFSRMAEVLLPSLIKLLPNSAKIISTSSSVTIRFIIKSTHAPRLLSIIKYQLSNSKSKEIHKSLCEIVERIVHTWPPQTLERCLSDLQQVIRLGICDSDEQARCHARRAFNGFADIFKDSAEQLYLSLDLPRQRILNSENNLATMSNHGSTNSLTSSSYYTSTGTCQQRAKPIVAPTTSNPSNSGAAARSVENLYGFTSRLQSIKPTRTAVASTLHPRNTAASPASAGSNHFGFTNTNVGASSYNNKVASSPYSNRSTSVIDVAAQRRAKTRAYLNTMYHRPRQIPTSSSSTLTATASTISTSTHHSPPVSHAPALNTQRRRSGIPVAANIGGGLSSSRSTSPSSANAYNQSSPTHHTHAHANANYTNGNGNGYGINNNNHSPTLEDQLARLALADSSNNYINQNNEARAGVASLQTNIVDMLKSVVENSTKIDKTTDNTAITSTSSVIKYLTERIEQLPNEKVREMLNDLMPSLIKAYDNPEAAVRKAAVFAMVAIHGKVGIDQMEPHLSNLSFSKRKLLNVYIEKK